MAKDDLTKKEEEIMDVLDQNGQVIVDDVKTLRQLAKKLEKSLGKADVVGS